MCINKFAKLLTLIITIFACKTSHAQPCGEIPIDKEYRVVLLIDGSGSMSMKDGYNKLWDPTMIAVRKQIQAFPEGTELQIIVFNTVGTRAHWQKHSTGKLTDQSRGNALRFVQRLSDPKGGTPFYYSLDKVIESQNQWLKEGPTYRTADVIIYVDGEDLSAEGSGADGFNKDGKVSRRDKITIDTVNKKMVSLRKDKTNLGLNIDISLVRLHPKYKTEIIDVDVYELGEAGIVPIMHPVTVTSTSYTLPEVVSGETAITLDVDIMCPEYIESSNSKMQIRAESKSRGVTITSKTRSIDIKKDVNRQKVTLQIRGTAADIAKGFRGELIFEYPKNRSHPIQGTTNIDFTVAAKKQPPHVSKSKIQVQPRVVMVGDQVRLDYLSPIANSTPSWSREDGEPITNSNKWNNATTRFTEAGDYKVYFAVTRGGLSSNKIFVTVPVKDVTLSLVQVTKNPIAGSDVEFMVSYTGLRPAAYQWRVDGDIVRGEVEHVLTHRFEQHGKRTVEVRGTIKLGDREFPTKWYSTTVDIAERKAIHLNVPAEHCWGAFVLKAKVFVDGNIQEVCFDLIDPTGRRVGKQQKKPVQETMQPGGHLDKTAYAQFVVPEMDGEFKVRVSDCTGNIIVEKDVVLRGPQFRVTLDDPQLTGQNIFVGEEKQFQLTIHGREAVAVNKVSWSLFNQSGEDQPAPVTNRNDQFRVSFDVFLPKDGLIANGETSTSTLKFFTARGTELMVPGIGQWHITARHREQEYEIQTNKDPQIDWEDSIRVFQLHPFSKNIDKIEWTVLKNGNVVHKALGQTFDYDFTDDYERNGTGDYEIRVIANLIAKGMDDVHLPLTRTLSGPSCDYEIQDDNVAPVEWGETRTFKVTRTQRCANYIKKIEWTVLKNGNVVHQETTRDQLKYTFEKDGPGVYEIKAKPHSNIQGVDPVDLDLTLTVSPLLCIHKVEMVESGQLNWGETRTFKVVTDCPTHIGDIKWSIYNEDGNLVHSGTEETIEYEFMEKTGLHEIVADISYNIPGTDPQTEKLSQTVSIVTGTPPNVVFKKRTIRGAGLFRGTLKTSGSYVSAEIQFTPTKGGETKTTFIKINSSDSHEQEFSSDAYEYEGEALGEIEVVLVIERPNGKEVRSEQGKLLQRHPPAWDSFLYIFIPLFVLVLFFYKIFANNQAALWSLVVASKLENIREKYDPGSVKLRVKKFNWKRWSKTVVFPLSRIASEIEIRAQEETPGDWMTLSGDHKIEMDKSGQLEFRSNDLKQFTWAPTVQLPDPESDPEADKSSPST